jgi:hypothetical protein
MNDRRKEPVDGSAHADAARYDLWFDGLLEGEEARAVQEHVAADPRRRAQYEADRDIEASLQRTFGEQRAARPRPGPVASLAPLASTGAAWPRYAAAAGVLLAAGIAFEFLGTPNDGQAPLASGPKSPATTFAIPVSFPTDSKPRQCALGDVFLDALAVEFQPLLGCKVQDEWNAELLAQLETAPCNREEGVVVLGEWVDPRVDVANMVLLRRGENPIMLVVPNCEHETDLCVPKDSGLFVHRGVRNGRPIYEVSPLPGSEVLACVDARDVITQQQL